MKDFDMNNYKLNYFNNTICHNSPLICMNYCDKLYLFLYWLDAYNNIIPSLEKWINK